MVLVGNLRFHVSLYRHAFTIFCNGETREGRSAVDLDSGAQISSFLHSLLSFALYTGSFFDDAEFIQSLIRDGVSSTCVPLHESVLRLAKNSIVKFKMEGPLGRLTVVYKRGFSFVVLKDKMDKRCDFLLLFLPQCCTHEGGDQFTFQPIIFDGTRLPKVSFSVPLRVLKLLSRVLRSHDIESLERWSQLGGDALERFRRAAGVTW